MSQNTIEKIVLKDRLMISVGALYGVIIGLVLVVIALCVKLNLVSKKNPRLINTSLADCGKGIYEQLFDQVNDAIVILDDQQNFVDANEKAIDIYGYSKEEFLKMNVKDLIPPEQLERSSSEFENLTKQGSYEGFIGKVQRKNGEWIDVEVNSTVIRKDGEILGSRDIIRNITEKVKEAEEKEKLILELKGAIVEIKDLQRILPICSFCKKIRDDEGYWEQVDVYLKNHLQTDLSHGVCPDCFKVNYPEFEEVEPEDK